MNKEERILEIGKATMDYIRATKAEAKTYSREEHRKTNGKWIIVQTLANKLIKELEMNESKGPTPEQIIAAQIELALRGVRELRNEVETEKDLLSTEQIGLNTAQVNVVYWERRITERENVITNMENQLETEEETLRENVDCIPPDFRIVLTEGE